MLEVAAEWEGRREEGGTYPRNKFILGVVHPHLFVTLRLLVSRLSLLLLVLLPACWGSGSGVESGVRVLLHLVRAGEEDAREEEEGGEVVGFSLE